MVVEIWQDEKRRARCRSCGRPIEWAINARTNRPVAFDGEIVAIRTQGNMLTDRVREIIDTAVTTQHRCERLR
jgi:hypothetical protein